MNPSQPTVHATVSTGTHQGNLQPHADAQAPALVTPKQEKPCLEHILNQSTLDVEMSSPSTGAQVPSHSEMKAAGGSESAADMMAATESKSEPPPVMLQQFMQSMELELPTQMSSVPTPALEQVRGLHQ